MRTQYLTPLILALLLSSCADYAHNPDSGIPDGIDNGDASADGDTQETAVMVLFMVDTSQSMAVDDPHSLRKTEVARAINMYAEDPRVRFAIMRMGGRAALLTDGFIRSLSTLQEAVVELGTIQGMASYRDALGLAEATLEENMNHDGPVPEERTSYLIFLLSDSMYEPGYPAEQAEADWESIMALEAEYAVESLEAHTALLVDPDVNLNPELLEEMIGFMSGLADAGQGTFTNYHDSEYLDFESTIAP